MLKKLAGKIHIIHPGLSLAVIVKRELPLEKKIILLFLESI